MEITLKAARVNAGLCQREAAKALGICTNTVYKWECGKAYPDALHIKEIEKLYGVSYDDIIFLPRKKA